MIDQVVATNELIDKEVSKLDSSQVIHLNYELLNDEIGSLITDIGTRFGLQTVDIADLEVKNKNEVNLVPTYWDEMVTYMHNKMSHGISR